MIEPEVFLYTYAGSLVSLYLIYSGCKIKDWFYDRE